MESSINAILISDNDDVATAIAGLPKGTLATFAKGNEVIELRITDEIPKYHKFAVRTIHQHSFVRKYGEVIGVATEEIIQGSHVHEHNIKSPVDPREESQ